MNSRAVISDHKKVLISPISVYYNSFRLDIRRALKMKYMQMQSSLKMRIQLQKNDY